MKKSDITVFFVPFFGGKISSLKRHIQFIESLGFKTRFIDLEFSALKIGTKPVSSSTQNFGMKALWADQIEKALNEVSGPKIIFSFSNPTAAAIEAICRRGAHDILGLIADGGPTGEILKSMLNYFSVVKPIRFLPLKWAAATASAYLLTPNQKDFCFKDLSLLPPGFKILSIRGWKDPLISPKQIDLIFEPHAHLDWQKLALPKGEHLNGLKDFPADYEPGVQRFLEVITEMITSSQRPKDLQGSESRPNHRA